MRLGALFLMHLRETAGRHRCGQVDLLSQASDGWMGNLEFGYGPVRNQGHMHAI